MRYHMWNIFVRSHVKTSQWNVIYHILTGCLWSGGKEFTTVPLLRFESWPLSIKMEVKKTIPLDAFGRLSDLVPMNGHDSQVSFKNIQDHKKKNYFTACPINKVESLWNSRFLTFYQHKWSKHLRPANRDSVERKGFTLSII